jgi:deoxyribonuclease-4
MIGARVMQVFTKTPNQWRDPPITEEQSARFKAEVRRLGIRAVVAHDSYLINLASPQRRLRAMSMRSFRAELERCATLGIPWVVSHPGNYMDERDAGLRRNADAYAACLAEVEGPGVLIEGTAGTGTALGANFEELAELRSLMPPEIRPRVGFCLDTCHLYAAGYDLVNDWDGVWSQWGQIAGWENLRCLHLNDSQTPFASHRDRHAWIAEGSLGPEPFRRIMREPRFAEVIKIIETPKEDDPVRHDRRMLRRLKGYALSRSTVPA